MGDEHVTQGTETNEEMRHRREIERCSASMLWPCLEMRGKAVSDNTQNRKRKRGLLYKAAMHSGYVRCVNATCCHLKTGNLPSMRVFRNFIFINYYFLEDPIGNKYFCVFSCVIVNIIYIYFFFT